VLESFAQVHFRCVLFLLWHKTETFYDKR